MKKKIFLLLIAIFSGMITVTSAQDTESITFTTYYPSPYGSYNQLDTVSLNIVNSSSAVGSINFQGSNNAPTTGVNGVGEGSLYYNTGVHQFMYLDNTNTWRQFGGGIGDTCYTLCFQPVAGCDRTTGNWYTGPLRCSPGYAMTGIRQSYNGASYFTDLITCCK